ncbi:MAG: D-alanyl-D-alanine carboxypeptidase family protein [Bryobacteraceae bacterium]
MRALPLVLLSVLSPVLHAQHEPPAAPAAPVIAAKAFLLLDFNSGQTLAAHNARERVEPASLTKLMTAYLTFAALDQKRIRLDQVAPVSEYAWRTEGSRMFIEPRKPVTVEELIHGMVVQSGNDASIALAEAIAGSEEAFVSMMNREAQRLGLKDTHFVNATGLPHPQHYSSGRDLAELAAAVIRDFPGRYPLYSRREYRYNNITQSNRNRLLWADPTVDGMKTGYTENAGYCMVTSGKRGERRLVSVVLGAASEAARAIESQKLLNYGFKFYDGVRLYPGRQPVVTLEVFKGTSGKVGAGFLADLHLAVPRGQGEKLKARIESLQPLFAPIQAGQRIGTLKLMLDDRPYREVPVVALESVPLAGVLGRGWDALRMLFR